MRGAETMVVKPRAQETDRYGDPVGEPTGGGPIEGCIVWPRTSEEEGRGLVVLEGQNVFTPPGADVLARDIVTLRGEDWQVQGEPGDYRLRGRKKGLLVVLGRVGS